MSAPLSGQQFDLRPNMKDKPNSQGTLFRAEPSQRTPASRQPRGFSPERYKAVGQALGLDRPSYEERNTAKYGRPSRQPESRAHAIQTVARSTVPLEHLEDSQSDYVSMHVTDDPGRGGVEEGANGDYWAASHGQGAHIGVRPSAVKGVTPIHEIGHHHEAESHGWSYNTPAEKGKAEGYADKYADEHARTGGYKQKQMRPDTRSDRPYDWGNKQDPTQFAVSYNTERYGQPRNPLNDEQFNDHRPKGHIKGQLPLLDKISPISVTRGEGAPHWDYASGPRRPVQRRRATDDELAAGKPRFISGGYG